MNKLSIRFLLVFGVFLLSGLGQVCAETGLSDTSSDSFAGVTAAQELPHVDTTPAEQGPIVKPASSGTREEKGKAGDSDAEYEENKEETEEKNSSHKKSTSCREYSPSQNHLTAARYLSLGIDSGPAVDSHAVKSPSHKRYIIFAVFRI